MTPGPVNTRVPVTRLFEKTSAKGNRYFTGRLGNARVLLFRDEHADTGGDPVWQMYLADVPQSPAGGPVTGRAASEAP